MVFEAGIKSNYGGRNLCRDSHLPKEIYLKAQHCPDRMNIDKFVSNILIAYNSIQGMSTEI